MRHVFFAFALMVCACAIAEDASLIGTWQLHTPQLWQQLELNKDGTYQRSIVTAGSRRTEIGRWSGEVSVLVLQPDYVITTQGARVPLPPRDKQIDVAGVDNESMTLYYDGDAVETWQRLSQATASPPGPLARRKSRAITLPVPQVRLAAAQIEIPIRPDFLIAAPRRTRTATLSMAYKFTSVVKTPQLVMPTFDIAAPEVLAAEAVAVAPVPALPARTTLASPKAAPADLYPEAKVVELITRIACEELRYPQRDPATSAQRYQRLAQSLGFESSDPARLQRTLRYYQSNEEFLHAHQQAIARNSMHCVMAREQVSFVP